MTATQRRQEQKKRNWNTAKRVVVEIAQETAHEWELSDEKFCFAESQVSARVPDHIGEKLTPSDWEKLIRLYETTARKNK